jgi:NAD-dependent deacetylase
MSGCQRLAETIRISAMTMISSELQNKFNSAKSVCVLTGAGISAESGVPTFRGGGHSAVWKGMPFEEISSAKMLRDDLAEVWAWFDYRRGVLTACRPNAAHFALAAWANLFPDFTLVTQNVDGLHTVAGSPEVIELHGNINRARCVECGERCDICGIVPHAPDDCPACGAKMRPDVILFGEMLPDDAFEKAAAAAVKCELFFIVGTSALVYPAAGLATLAKQNGACLVEVNPEATPMTDSCDFTIRAKAGTVLASFGS